MNDWLLVLGLYAAVFVLQRWILPAAGIPT